MNHPYGFLIIEDIIDSMVEGDVGSVCGLALFYVEAPIRTSVSSLQDRGSTPRKSLPAIVCLEGRNNTLTKIAKSYPARGDLQKSLFRLDGQVLAGVRRQDFYRQSERLGSWWRHWEIRCGIHGCALPEKRIEELNRRKAVRRRAGRENPASLLGASVRSIPRNEV